MNLSIFQCPAGLVKMPKWPPATTLVLPTVRRPSTGKGRDVNGDCADGGGRTVMVGFGPAAFVAGFGWG